MSMLETCKHCERSIQPGTICVCLPPALRGITPMYKCDLCANDFKPEYPTDGRCKDCKSKPSAKCSKCGKQFLQKAPGDTMCEDCSKPEVHACPACGTYTRPCGIHLCTAAPIVGQKQDDGKNRLDLVPMSALWEVGKCFTLGVKAHGLRGWLTLEDGDARIFAALLRHALKWGMGERADPDDGISHLAHIASNALMLLDREARKQWPTVKHDTGV
jgi:DNA-directed RNA polymerase subunit RPC12/RpoP